MHYPKPLHWLTPVWSPPALDLAVVTLSSALLVTAMVGYWLDAQQHLAVSVTAFVLICMSNLTLALVNVTPASTGARIARRVLWTLVGLMTLALAVSLALGLGGLIS
jgi:hypothetical protein